MLYEAQCQKCKAVHEYFASVDERNNTPECCGEKTSKVMLTPPQVGAMNWGREKAVTMPDGTYIETGAEYKNYMKKNNKIPLEEGKQEAARAQKRKKKEWKQKIHDTVLKNYDKVASKYKRKAA